VCQRPDECRRRCPRRRAARNRRTLRPRPRLEWPRRSAPTLPRCGSGRPHCPRRSFRCPPRRCRGCPDPGSRHTPGWSPRIERPARSRRRSRRCSRWPRPSRCCRPSGRRHTPARMRQSVNRRPPITAPPPASATSTPGWSW